MKVWLDNHLSPAAARWISQRFGLECVAIRELGLQEADDPLIFARARDADAVLITKDQDFAELVERLGPPPRVIRLAFGNTSTARLTAILESRLETALSLLVGSALVEIIADD